MLIFKKEAKLIKELIARILNNLENLVYVIQGLLLITIIDELCYVKFTDKRALMKSVLYRSWKQDESQFKPARVQRDRQRLNFTVCYLQRHAQNQENCELCLKE